ncbi:MAG: O-antigen ligase family protein [Candidatus Thiodiazotropha sp. (ex Monitilora ramsayi)]|nr:O-antigen ligase family protein [Candidatus Thiodiazotropha sp. (ex Monitilora ramsayi)]
MNQKARLSTGIFVASYSTLIFSLVFANALSALKLLPDSILNPFRSFTHVIPITCFLFLYFLNHQRINISYTKIISFSLRGMAVLTMVLMMVMSGLANESDSNNFARMIVLIIHLFNLTVVLPASITYLDLNNAMEKLSKMYCWFVFLLSIYVLFQYIQGYGYSRLGYPFIPGVYAYMCVVALIVATIQLNSKLMPFIFLVFIFLSGSRSALALTFLFYIIHFLSSISLKRFVFISTIFVSLSLVLIVYEDISRPYVIEREDVTSGRLGIWSDAIDIMMESPILGHYQSFTFSDGENTEALAAHNSFLDLSIRYGIIFAILAYIYWLSFIPSMLNLRSPDYSILGIMLFIIVTTKSFITNIFWTNMGDGTSYFIITMIVSVSLSSRSTVKANEQ